jgi:hypothetical protein
MRVACVHCREILEYSGKRPSFCANCGKPMSQTSDQSTAELDAEAPTQAPGPYVPERIAADPTEVGRFRLVRVLGEGGMGRVFEAEDTATGRHVALKLIARSYASSPEAVERFRREGRLASALSHPRCVFVLAADEEAGRPYIVMELMPGDTLQDLQKRSGPLPVEEAIRKILDVIEGLEEAHRLGMVHRDVKPSNCFLEPDGRVKVGDFGLAKSLVSGAALTRTGSFIGTPLFASPEQIKGEPTGPQSDVYSVAATLYCLLTGKAPFQGSDAAATVARIVSDAPPPMRSLRPDLPEALDEVVLRGLERDRERRWQNLGQFRAALMPLLPGQLSLVGLGVRFGAYWIDHFILGLAITPLSFAVAWQSTVQGLGQNVAMQIGSHAISLLGYLVYFGLPEWRWGCSPAKFAFGFRVVRATGAGRPELWRSLLRVCVYWPLLHLYPLSVIGLQVIGLIYSPQHQDIMVQAGVTLGTCCAMPLAVVGPALLLCTMRARNGYRGLHEWASGTRVVRLPESDTHRTLGTRCRELLIARPEDPPPQLGPFGILGILRDGDDDAVLVGEDPALGRKTLIWLRSADYPPLSPEERGITRPTRLRWLAGGRRGDQQWDAFLFPAGHALTRVVASDGQLTWPETRYLLTQLTEELSAAQSDGTWPWSLAIDQVWIQGDGRLQLLDVPMSSNESEGDALPLLAEVAVLSLEGKARTEAEKRRRVHAPLPVHAAELLDGLVGPGKPYRKLRTFREDLADTADLPATVNRRRRFGHLALLATLLYFGLSGLVVMMSVVSGTGLALIGFFDLQTEEQVLNDIHALAARDVVAIMHADPITRAAALQHLQDDVRLCEVVTTRVQRKQMHQDSRLRSTSWVGRGVIRFFSDAVAAQRKAAGQISMIPRNPRTTRTMARQAGPELAEAALMGVCVATGIITATFLIMLAVYVVWAFLWRGGITFRLFGISLVRRDGRPASRLQCSWRAMLFWSPVATLLVASVCLDTWYWLHWDPVDSEAYLAWLSSMLWWAGIAMFPLYAFLALRSPGQSLHDRLAGTYLVPR